MAINNITQTISTIPEAAHRGVDVQTAFVIKQEDFQDHLQGVTVNELNTLKAQLNSRIGEINSTTTTMNGYADTASAGASTSTTKAGEASTSAGEALAYKNQAETFKNNASNSATKASQWADNNYNVEVETGKYSAKHWSTVAQNATANKIDKVTSTDNAVVRFDGATGQVQNSGVIIDDNGNVGIGTGSPDFPLEVVGNDTTVKISNNNTGASTTALQIGGYSGMSSGLYGATLRSIHNFGFTAASSLAFELAGIERMRIDANGNVGIGVTPSNWDFNKQSITLKGAGSGIIGGISSPGGDSNNTTIFNNCFYNNGWIYAYTEQAHPATKYDLDDGAHIWSISSAGTAGNTIAWKNAMVLDASGQLSLNPTSSTTAFVVNVNTTTGISCLSSNLQAASTGWCHLYGASSNSAHADIVIYGNGNIVNSNNSYGAFSDVKLKENIVDTSPKLDKLMQVRVVNYNLIGDKQKQIGVIAQEIEKILPSIVDETKDTKQVEVEKERIIPALEEITEQKLVQEAVLNDDGTILEEAIYETIVIQEAKPESIEKYTETETIETGETTKNVKYSVIYMMMLKGMQEQQEIINDLKTRIEILEGAK